MLLYSILLLVGFLILFKSADQFVIGAVATARNLNISPMIVGLTVVALGTSAPEIFVAASSSLSGEPELAIGNAIGSNIANMGMVLGLTALIVPLPYKKEALKNDLPMVILVSLLAGITLMDLHLGLWDGVLLLCAFALFLYRVAKAGKLSMDEFADELSEADEMSLGKAALYLVLSLVFLLLSSELLVYAVIAIAEAMGISELVIGLTVIAVGTSLPELVVSMTSATKGQTDLAIGNVLGSNIFNILAVLSVPSLLAATDLSAELLYRDYTLMMAMTIVIAIFAYGMRKKPQIGRPIAVLLLCTWIAYLISLYLQATQ